MNQLIYIIVRAHPKKNSGVDNFTPVNWNNVTYVEQLKESTDPGSYYASGYRSIVHFVTGADSLLIQETGEQIDKQLYNRYLR